MRSSMNARALLALTCIVALVTLFTAGIVGCGGKGGSGGGGGAIVLNVGRYNTLTLQWRPDFQSGASNSVSGVLALAKSAVPQFQQGRDLVIMRISASSTDHVAPFTEIVGFDDGTFFDFSVVRDNSDIVFDFVIDTTGERVLVGSAFNNEPYILKVPGSQDRVAGVTLANNALFLFDGKRRREFSGAFAPGTDGDNKVRFLHKGGNTWDVFVQLDGALQGSPSIGLRASWLNNLSSGAPVLMSGVNDGWFGLTNQIIDARHQFRVVGFNAGDPNAADRETLATDGSVFAAVASGLNVFEANFAGGTTGIVHHPAVTLNSPAAIRITPPHRDIIIGQTVRPRILGDYTVGLVRQTLDITTLVPTASLTTNNSNILRVNAATSEVTGLALGSATVQTSFGGRNTPAVTINVVNRPVRSIAIAALQTTLNIGVQLQFTLNSVFENADGSTTTVTDPAAVTWSSSNNGVASIGATTGLLTGVGGGSTNITASAGGVTSNIVTINVLGTPQSLVLTAPATTANVGSTIQLTVTANLVGGGSLDVTRIVTYNVSNTGVATVDSNGLLTGRAAGTTNVSATAGGVTSNNLTFTIVAPAQPPVTINLTTASTAPISSGGTVQLTATRSDGQAGQFTFRSSDTTVAVVSSSGLVTGQDTLNGGTALITAEQTINGVLVPSNSVEIDVLGLRGPHNVVENAVITTMYYWQQADVDLQLQAGTGNVEVNTNVDGGFQVNLATVSRSFAGPNNGTVAYRVHFRSQLLAAGTNVDFNFRRGNVFTPDSRDLVAPVRADVVPNGLGGAFCRVTVRQ